MTPELLFSALSHELRLRCLVLLHQEGELCVCELTQALALPQPSVSRHLALLRESGWVTDRRQGQWVYYRLNPQLPAWAGEVLAVTVPGVGESEPYVQDRLRLGQMSRPVDRGCV